MDFTGLTLFLGWFLLMVGVGLGIKYRVSKLKGKVDSI